MELLMKNGEHNAKHTMEKHNTMKQRTKRMTAKKNCTSGQMNDASNAAENLIHTYA